MPRWVYSGTLVKSRKEGSGPPRRLKLMSNTCMSISPSANCRGLSLNTPLLPHAAGRVPAPVILPKKPLEWRHSGNKAKVPVNEGQALLL